MVTIDDKQANHFRNQSISVFVNQVYLINYLKIFENQLNQVFYFLHLEVFSLIHLQYL